MGSGNGSSGSTCFLRMRQVAVWPEDGTSAVWFGVTLSSVLSSPQLQDSFQRRNLVSFHPMYLC